MKERTEKQPIDELFARKLENMSLPPGPDGFARLQARMGQGTELPKVVFWRNATVQRYMALAACLLLVCLFGWLYMTNEGDPVRKGDVAAANPAKAEKDDDNQVIAPLGKPIDEVAQTQAVPKRTTPGSVTYEADQIKPLEKNGAKESEGGIDTRAVAAVKPSPVKAPKLPLEAPLQETAKPAEQIARVEVSPVTAEPISDKPSTAAVSKPRPPAERVLVVTIAEPEALVAARRTVKASVQEETVADADAKADRETKGGSLWSQVIKLKQGEIFARKDEGEDDRGLLGRAYSGLKHSLDKDKSIKQ
ncbi:hypothetical protein [Spirosoma rigui]|uniref:hypothetical protein n=1 Tax=Spirosoma rigui TaxID=564064 RepID=UPI0009AF6CF1|nr:hypothetical protein [Spirosoma rigui]